jgi:tetratricopeptide (TPR) repeat protein
VRERRSDEEPLYPHSVEIQVLSQTGLVGAALFVGFFVAAGLAVARARHLGAFGRAVAAAALSSCAYWLGHGSGDWLWEFPGLAAPALACLGLAAGLGRAARVEANGAPMRRRRLFAATAATVGVAGAASLTLPWLSAKEVDAAAAAWRGDPRAAFDRLERARTLNPLSERPDLLAGAIASRRRDWPGMRAAFARALERNPSSWYAEFELAVVDAVQGRRSSALRHLERARRLNPREPALAVLGDRIRRGAAVDPDDFDRFFLLRLGERTG